MQATVRHGVQELVANDLKRREVVQLREIENLRAEVQRWKLFHGMLVECHRAAVDRMVQEDRAGWAVIPPELTGSNLAVDWPCSLLRLSEAMPGDEALSLDAWQVY